MAGVAAGGGGSARQGNGRSSDGRGGEAAEGGRGPGRESRSAFRMHLRQGVNALVQTVVVLVLVLVLDEVLVWSLLAARGASRSTGLGSYPRGSRSRSMWGWDVSWCGVVCGSWLVSSASSFLLTCFHVSRPGGVGAGVGTGMGTCDKGPTGSSAKAIAGFFWGRFSPLNVLAGDGWGRQKMG